MADSPLGNGATGGEQNSSPTDGGNDFTASAVSVGSASVGPGDLNKNRLTELSGPELSMVSPGGQWPVALSSAENKTGPVGTNRAPYRLS